jgi:UDP-MurNAc hydroxylase
MRVHFLRSATVVVEANGLRILMDPWLVDGAYYGSWALYPHYEWNDKDLSDIDYIYVSHIHPDHAEKQTLQRLDKTPPVLIHKYNTPYLKKYLNNLGFSVIELQHGHRFHLRNNTHITILAADDCDPAVCGKFFSCAFPSEKGSAQIDSLCVLEDGKSVLVNTNDCPLDLARSVLPKILNTYGPPDLLLASYGGAGPYPQCFSNFTDAKKLAEANARKHQIVEMLHQFSLGLKAKRVFPFAGQYELCGSLAHLNPYRNVAEVDEAYDYLAQRGVPIVKIAPGAWYDIAGEAVTEPYTPVDRVAKQVYIDTVLVNRKLDYEDDPTPSDGDLLDLCRAAHERLEHHREKLRINTDAVVYIDLGAITYPIRMGGIPMNHSTATIKMTVDKRLLHKILTGPVLAHWNNAEVGSHITFHRQPNTLDKSINYLMNFFHA